MRDGSSPGRGRTTFGGHSGLEKRQSDPLVNLADLNFEPAFRITFHIGADPSARDHLRIAVNPSDRLRTGRRARGNQPSPCEQVYVELQALLQAYSLSRSRHLNFHQLQTDNIPLSASSP